MAKYKFQEPRAGLIQAKLVHRAVCNGKVTERLEWIGRDIPLGATVQVDGDTRYWTVKEIYNQGTAEVLERAK